MPPHQNGSRPKTESKPESNGHQNVGGYRLLRELDTDSLGSVYEAEHPRLHRRGALRPLRPRGGGGVSFSPRLLLRVPPPPPPPHQAGPPPFQPADEGD